MTAIEVLPVQSILQAIGETLIHFVWQGLLVWLLLASWNVLLRGKPTSLRYIAACAAMLLMLSLPLITFFRVLNTPADGLMSVNAISSTHELSTRVAKGNSVEELSETSNVSISPAAGWATFTSPALARLRVATPALPWIGIIWLFGVFAFSLRTFGGLIVIRRLKRTMRTQSLEQWQEVVRRLSRRLRVSRSVRLCESAQVEVPAVIGYLRPIIIVPARALTGLGRQHLEALLAHELAHIRRHDYLVNLLQMVVETLFFYHPAVWWISSKVRHERENCCDDLAVAACGDVLTYARALTALEELRLGSPPSLAVAATGGGSLFGRVRRLLETPSPVSRPAFCLASLITVAIGCFIWVGAQQVGVSPVQDLASAQEVEKASSLPLGARGIKSSEDEAVNRQMASVPSRSAPHQSATATAEASDNPELLDTTNDAAASNPQTQSQPKDKPESIEEFTPVNQISESAQLLNELAAAGYPNLRVDQIVELKNHGVNAQFIKDMKELGYNSLSPATLMEMRDHGVVPEFVKGLARLNYNRLSPRQLIDAKDHGVTPEFIRQMSYAGFASLSLDQLIKLRDHSVDARFVSELQQVGYERLTFAQLLTLRNHNVTGSFIRGLQSAGYANLDVDDVVRLRNRGLTGAFIQKARAEGFGRLSLDELLRLYESGIIN